MNEIHTFAELSLGHCFHLNEKWETVIEMMAHIDSIFL